MPLSSDELHIVKKKKKEWLLYVYCFVSASAETFVFWMALFKVQASEHSKSAYFMQQLEFCHSHIELFTIFQGPVHY
jgi:hypothetical protein